MRIDNNLGRKVTVTVGLALLGGLVALPARAGDQQQSTIVPSINNNPTYHLTKHGKMKIKPSTKEGEGGIVMKLTFKGIDCPPNNDGGTVGKCGAAPTTVVNHVMVLSTDAIGQKFVDIVGVKYKVEKGTALFQATGSNKINGSLFGALVSLIFNTPLGIGNVDFRQAGTDPADCDNVPLPPKTCQGGGGTNCASGAGRHDHCPCTVNGDCTSAVCATNGCSDGAKYALTGIIAGSDPGVSCADAGDCSVTQLCTGNICVQETCTIDANCDQNGGGDGGTGQCGSDGKCCDPNIDPTCTAQVP